jgi:phage terminase large subunit-like protein
MEAAAPVESRHELEELVSVLEELNRRANMKKLEGMYPETGVHRRELYPKHMAFLACAEAVKCAIAANRVGKTEGMGGYELAVHLTGQYPAWWTGKRFTKPVRAWGAGNTGKSTAEILQAKLLGPKEAPGTGLIPGMAIDWSTRRTKQGVPDGISTIAIRHASGGLSRLTFKSYDQGTEAFEGTEQEVILLDEEPPLEIFSECRTRTMTTGGVVMMTFTPLQGLTPLIKHLRETGAFEVSVTWDDVPHLTAKDKAELLKDTPEYLRDARSKGIPVLGSGLVFTVSEASITVQPFLIPKHWVQIGGLDFGWDHPQAGAHLAYDRDTDIVYVTRCARARQKTPAEFAVTIRPWGATDPSKPMSPQWLPWAWPHDGLQHDKGSGDELAQKYRDQGLLLLAQRATWANGTNGFEAGITDILTRMQEGKWKVFATCSEYFEEFRNYHRDDGIVVKVMDDVLDATRVARMMLRFAEVKPAARIARTASTVGDTSLGY